jgi:hypothetical protein
MVLVSAKKKLVIVNEQQQKIEEVLTKSLGVFHVRKNNILLHVITLDRHILITLNK